MTRLRTPGEHTALEIARAQHPVHGTLHLGPDPVDRIGDWLVFECACGFQVAARLGAEPPAQPPSEPTWNDFDWHAWAVNAVAFVYAQLGAIELAAPPGSEVRSRIEHLRTELAAKLREAP